LKIKTRLGEGDRLVNFESDLESPFGNRIRMLTIPSHWVRGAEGEEQPEIIASGGGRIEFGFGSRNFIYDRWGLRPKKDEKGHKPDDDLVDQ
jgi:hypothetical protein